MIRFTRTPHGPQCFLFGRRIHHFAAGLLVVAGGIWAIWDDRDDFVSWLLGLGDFGRPARRLPVKALKRSL